MTPSELVDQLRVVERDVDDPEWLGRVRSKRRKLEAEYGL